MQACSQGIIVSKDQFQDNCFKRNIRSIAPCFDALSYFCEYLVEAIRVVSVNLVLFLSARLLFLDSFKGPFSKYLIYFTFSKSVAIKKIESTT